MITFVELAHVSTCAARSEKEIDVSASVTRVLFRPANFKHTNR